MEAPGRTPSISRGLDPLDPSLGGSRAAARLLAREQRSGQAWNVTRTIANAPAVLEMIDGTWNALARSSLSVADRELVAMELAVGNGCHYCVPAHRYIAGHEPAIHDSERSQLMKVSRGETLPTDTRLGLMQELVRRLAASKGDLSDSEFAAFVSNGITPQQMVETIAEIAQSTITNFTNRLARTPLDSFLEPYR